jgi:hypothetical protein
VAARPPPCLPPPDWKGLSSLLLLERKDTYSARAEVLGRARIAGEMENTLGETETINDDDDAADGEGGQRAAAAAPTHLSLARAKDAPRQHPPTPSFSPLPI